MTNTTNMTLILRRPDVDRKAMVDAVSKMIQTNRPAPVRNNSPKAVPVVAPSKRHAITKAIEAKPLHEKLTAHDCVDFHILVSGLKRGRATPYMFAVRIIINDGAHPSSGQLFTGPSDTNKSNAQRGELAGALFALEWLSLNTDPQTTARIHSVAQYVSDWLPEKINEWRLDTSRNDFDLINKIAPLMDRAKALEFRKASKESAERERMRPILETKMEKLRS
jgi:hypothetical protein